MARVKSGFAALSVFALLATSGVAVAKDAKKNQPPKKDQECTAYYGPFHSNTGEPCTSPIGLCTHGMLEGEFPATYDATFLTMEWAGDTSDPTKFVYTGTSVVAALDGSGTFYTDDTGIIHIPEDGSPASFVTKAIVASGTQSYDDTSGGFVAAGSLLFSTGAAVGTFSAVLCDPRHDNGHGGGYRHH